MPTRQNVLITHDLTAGGEWYENINIEFTPDEVIVRSIGYHNDKTETELGYITTNMVKDNIIGFYGDGLVSNSQQTFTVNKPVNGAYLFQLRLVDGTIDGGSAGVLMISLEFIKY